MRNRLTTSFTSFVAAYLPAVLPQISLAARLQRLCTGGMMETTKPGSATTPLDVPNVDHFRFHRPHAHLAPAFGNDKFALKAEAFARFFGTPFFLGAQTVIVGLWIAVNALGFTKFDVYPFILLNLAFSLQAAYAAPLILLAQTRQAARDNVHAEADAQHREALAVANAQRQEIAAQTAAQLLELLQRNTDLTELTQKLIQRVETLTGELHEKLVQRELKQ
ncbi:DUF1003 domain-containing protein [Paraburkholderia sp. RL17-347-BIC-D]|uniref:DUF1003 domain-containing protein n=1 Tax=Paraburkholderia sp. RL17-347-BIC-D TaxID=3031632 RepID=UPI0038BC0372